MAKESIKKVTNDSSSFTGGNGNGYCKMPDGTLICWGVLALQTAQIVNVTFPVPFVNGSPSITVSSGAGSGRDAIFVEDVTLVNFTMFRPSGSAAQWQRYIAIGRWK